MGIKMIRNIGQKKNTILWGIILGVLVFQMVLEEMLPIANVFDECLALLCMPLAGLDFFWHKGTSHGRVDRTKRLQFVLLFLFLGTGLFSNIWYRYQPLWVVMVSAILSTKFFMILLTAGYLWKIFPIDLEQEEEIVCILSTIWFLYTALAYLFPEVLVRPQAWDICAKASLLFALLVFCEHKKVWLNRICILCMLLLLLFSGKEKAYGSILVFIILYYLVVHKKVQTKIRYILYMAVPIALLAWDKIYYYYVVGQGRFAKSVMSATAFQIVKDYFPFGTGFGTFGSTYAAKQYSPVYDLYGIAEHPELGEKTRDYLTDQFWPLLLGENGVVGTILYVGLILVLFLQIQRVYYYNKKKYMLLIYLLVFMLMTTFTETGFMQPMVMIYAFVMGILLEEYEEKRSQKMKYFE